MKQLARDVKTILTKTAFNIPPHLVGRTLATPRRRLLAFLLDFIIASIIYKIVGSGLSVAVGILLILPIFIKSLRSKLRRSTSIVLFIIGIIFLITAGAKYYTKEFKDEYIDPILSGKYETKEDSLKAQKLIEKINVAIDKDTTGQARQALDEIVVNDINFGSLLGNKQYEISLDSINAQNIRTAKIFYIALKSKDSTEISNVWESMEYLVAGEKLKMLENEIDSLDEQVEDLEDEIDELEENLENPSFGYVIKAAINDIGFSLGWFAFYMIFCWFLFDGSSPGKRLLHIKIIRMNGHDLKLWYCFERFSGYAAGVATGLLGFAQIYWDDNRQCIHDKIASTVVINMKPKKEPKIRWYKKLFFWIKSVIQTKN